MFKIDAAFIAKFRAYLVTLKASLTKAYVLESGKRRNKQFVELTLDVRRVLRAALVTEGATLVQAVQTGRITLIDDYQLQRDYNGTVHLTKPGITAELLDWHELLKLGAEGTRIVSSGVIAHRWEQHIAGPIWEQLGMPRMAFDFLSGLTHESSDAETTCHVLQHLQDALKARFLRNFWGERKAGSVLGDALWRQVLDREVASLTLKLFGSSATLRQYNWVAQNASVLRQLSRETPNLMRLLGVKLETRDIAVFEDGVTTQAARHLREHYLSKGFTPAGWAFLTHQGASMVHLLASTGPRMINRLAELQCGKLPYGRWIYHLVHRGIRLASVDNFCKLLVVYGRDYARRKTTAKELTDHMVFLLDYFGQENPPIGRQTTFKGVLRKQEEWHRKLAHEHRQRQLDKLTELYTWPPLVQTLELGEAKATSLNSSLELLEEGMVMGHCVGGYFQACYYNHCRIYSLTVAGQRVATLEVAYRGTSWTQGQLYGPGNRKIIDKQVIQLARRVVAACNKAPALDASLNTVTPLKAREPKPNQRLGVLMVDEAEEVLPF